MGGSIWVEGVCEQGLRLQCIYLWEEHSMCKVGRGGVKMSIRDHLECFGAA